MYISLVERKYMQQIAVILLQSGKTVKVLFEIWASGKINNSSFHIEAI
jgi:hypothetical protein